ncbi:MAG: hypothetical protein ACFE8L_11000 [Candidatus Hodarchaeota archaeon]
MKAAWKLIEFVNSIYEYDTKRIMSAMEMFNNIEGFEWTVGLWAIAEEIAAIG